MNSGAASAEAGSLGSAALMLPAERWQRTSRSERTARRSRPCREAVHHPVRVTPVLDPVSKTRDDRTLPAREEKREVESGRA